MTVTTVCVSLSKSGRNAHAHPCELTSHASARAISTRAVHYPSSTDPAPPPSASPFTYSSRNIRKSVLVLPPTHRSLRVACVPTHAHAPPFPRPALPAFHWFQMAKTTPPKITKNSKGMKLPKGRRSPPDAAPHTVGVVEMGVDGNRALSSQHARRVRARSTRRSSLTHFPRARARATSPTPSSALQSGRSF